MQDAAAALPALLLAVRPGELVADLCAAPGGKTAQLAASGASVVAVERDTRRGGAATGEYRPAWAGRGDRAGGCGERGRPEALFDAVLLDAPCSATGTIRRHPDVAHLKSAKDVAGLAEGQRSLLAAAGKLLKPGGRLVYAVCSLQREEGEAVVTAVVPELRRVSAAANALPGLATAVTQAGDLRTTPALWQEVGGMDGFFCAQFVKP